MQYGGYYPATYQNPYQNPYTQYQAPAQQNFQQPAQQTLTPPTIHAEIIQVDGGSREVESFPVNAGCSQMFMSKDEQTIFIKSVFANGQHTITEYQRQAQKQDSGNALANYVTIDMLNDRLQELSAKFQQKEEDTGA